jgi:hypothetical protein
VETKELIKVNYARGILVIKHRTDKRGHESIAYFESTPPPPSFLSVPRLVLPSYSWYYSKFYIIHSAQSFPRATQVTRSTRRYEIEKLRGKRLGLKS